MNRRCREMLETLPPPHL